MKELGKALKGILIATIVLHTIIITKSAYFITPAIRDMVSRILILLRFAIAAARAAGAEPSAYGMEQAHPQRTATFLSKKSLELPGIEAVLF